MISREAFMPPGNTTLTGNGTPPEGLRLLSIWQRLMLAGYSREQADAVLGVQRTVEKNCNTCLRTISLSTPFCGECVRNPRSKDHWRPRHG